jgi:hypothetical protein
MDSYICPLVQVSSDKIVFKNDFLLKYFSNYALFVSVIYDAIESITFKTKEISTITANVFEEAKLTKFSGFKPLEKNPFIPRKTILFQDTLLNQVRLTYDINALKNQQYNWKDSLGSSIQEYTSKIAIDIVPMATSSDDLYSKLCNFIVKDKRMSKFLDKDPLYKPAKIIDYSEKNLPDQLSSSIRGNPEFEKFFTSQYKFIQSLTPEEKKILKSYTYKGDRVINTILRSTSTPTYSSFPPLVKNTPFIKQFVKGGDIQTIIPTPAEIKEKPPINIVGALPLYMNKFLTIFKKLPPLKESIKVYRGISSTDGLNFEGDQFLSTSYKTSTAAIFSGEDCCILNITVYPGVKALWIEPLSRYTEESEILIVPPFKVTYSKMPNKYRYTTQYNVVIKPVVSAGGGKTRRRSKRSHRTIKRTP